MVPDETASLAVDELPRGIDALSKKASDTTLILYTSTRRMGSA